MSARAPRSPESTSSPLGRSFSSRTSSTSAPRTLPVGLLNLMQAQQSAAQYGTMYAGLVLVMLPTLILYICVQKQLTQGMTVGGLKG